MLDPSVYQVSSRLPPQCPTRPRQEAQWLSTDSLQQLYGRSISEYTPGNIDIAFDISDAEDCIKIFRKLFKIINPGGHTCKRNPEQSSISFVHCRHASALGKRYSQIQHLLEERAKMEFFRTCVFRIHSALAFVQDLENLAHAEFRTLYAINHNCLTDVPMCKLYCLNGLCEDLRVHLGHLDSIKQRLHTNKWLHPNLGKMYLQVEWVCRMLKHLQEKSIWWMEKLIIIGLEVFAHGDIDGMTHEILWNITRGLEDFNSIVGVIGPAHPKSLCLSLLTGIENCYHNCSPVDPVITNFPAHIGGSVRSIPISRVFNILANERSRYAALETHRFFTSNDNFMRTIYSKRLTQWVWNDELNSLNHSVSSCSYPQDLETSDYHTATGSTTSISGAILKVGQLRAPDLSNLASPLVQLAAKEQMFAEMFLLIVCNSTGLLRKAENSKSRQRTSKTLESPVLSRPPRGGQGTPVLSRSDSKRKCVSWGDNANQSLRIQIITRYMDTLWQYFGSNLVTLFHEPCWNCHKSLLQSEFGSLLLCNATVIMMLCHMIDHVCLKDLFPPASVLPLLSVSRSLHALSALSAWDNSMCESLGSRALDKCYPCPLANNNYSTKTGRLLRDTYQSLFSMLQQYLQDLPDALKGSECILPRQEVDMLEVVTLTCRLHATCAAAHSWCALKTNHFLSSWNVGNFLLITQTDLKMLADETKKVVYQVQKFCKNPDIENQDVTEVQMQIYLNMIAKQINDINTRLQSLSGAVMKIFSENCKKMSMEYFKKTMPVGKVWRKKADTELPTRHNMYIEHALETILEPVVDGVSKLKQTAQLSAISLATMSVIEAWTSFILKERIKFSYIGAFQLHQDFKFVKAWLTAYISNDDVRQSILDLPVFLYLGGVVTLLKKQPRKRSSSRFREPSSVDNLACESTAGVKTSDPNLARVSDEDLDRCEDNDIRNVPNVNDWLALRVNGGIRAWRLPSCFATNSGNA